MFQVELKIINSKGIKMAIANAVQRGNMVYVYNEKGSLICSIASGSGPNNGLKGYTGSSVNIQKGNMVYMYNEKGSITHTVPA